MVRRSPRGIRAAVLVSVAAGALVLGVMPATAATTTAAAPHDFCIPSTWYTVTDVITRDGIFQLLPTVVEPNNSSTPSTLSMTVTISGSLTAGLTGNIPVAPAGIAASIGPSVQANISGSVAVTASTTVPPGETGYLQFGIITEKTNGIAYQRDFFCNVTSQPAVATAPEGFGYIASSAPTTPGATSASSRHHTTVAITKR